LPPERHSCDFDRSSPVLETGYAGSHCHRHESNLNNADVFPERQPALQRGMTDYRIGFETKLFTSVAYGVGAFFAASSAVAFFFAVQIYTESPFGPLFSIPIFAAVVVALVYGYRPASRGVASRGDERQRVRRAVGFLGCCVGFFVLFNVAIALFVPLGSLYGSLSYGLALASTLALSYLLAYRLDLFN